MVAVSACCSNPQSLTSVWNLHKTVAEWFDKTDYVKRYSPFGVMQDMQGVNQMNALMSPGGEITTLGTWVSRGGRWEGISAHWTVHQLFISGHVLTICKSLIPRRLCYPLVGDAMNAHVPQVFFRTGH